MVFKQDCRNIKYHFKVKLARIVVVKNLYKMLCYLICKYLASTGARLSLFVE